jgi:hypothetical protein
MDLCWGMPPFSDNKTDMIDIVTLKWLSKNGGKTDMIVTHYNETDMIVTHYIESK